MIVIISGYGKPSSKRIIDALKDHVKEGSTIVHDDDHSRYKLMQLLNCKEEVYKAIKNDKEYLEKMELTNNKRS